jgi:hypothetical protein
VGALLQRALSRRTERRDDHGTRASHERAHVRQRRVDGLVHVGALDIVEARAQLREQRLA